MTDLKDGETFEMQGSARKPYVLRNLDGVYDCSCPAWRNQSKPTDLRTCKHLKKLRGTDAEIARIGSDAARGAVKTTAVKATAPALLLAHSWKAEDPTGWWISEKLDGVRAYWDGKQFISRLGNKYHAPDWFTKDLPDTPLDGELWCGRGKFQETVSIVRRANAGEKWTGVAYLVFDAPSFKGDFEDRQAYLWSVLEDDKLEYARMVQQDLCLDRHHLDRELARVEKLGGEGLMIRQPHSAYEAGRSTTLYKVKTFHDAEATVTGYTKGRGKHKGKVGALLVKTDDGVEFSVGTGLNDAERADPPAIGSVITYRYQELTNAGIPRFPSFMRERTDVPRKKVTKSKPAKQVEPVASTAGKRYFEFKSEKSCKFWEITLSGSSFSVRYGKIGSDGSPKTKSFATEDKAQKEASKLISKKLNKGYLETTW